MVTIEKTEKLAHFDKETHSSQPLIEHLVNTANSSRSIGQKINFAKTSFLLGILHDIGKADPLFQDYLQSVDSIKLMNLPNATPSRAITYTIANTEKDFSKKLEKYKRKVLGRVEGDIPHIILNDSAYLTLHFQDLQYIDISPNEIRSVSCELVDVTSIDQNIVEHSLEHSYEAGNISIKLKPEMFPANDSGEVWYKMAITTEYGYKGKVYTGITAVIVLDK